MHIDNFMRGSFLSIAHIPEAWKCYSDNFYSIFPLGVQEGKNRIFSIFQKVLQISLFFCNRVFFDMGNSNLKEFFDFEHWNSLIWWWLFLEIPWGKNNSISPKSRQKRLFTLSWGFFLAGKRLPMELADKQFFPWYPIPQNMPITMI
jgi:hypothetical protein